LIYSTDTVFLVEKKINKSGRMSKRIKKTNVLELGTYDPLGIPIEKLFCKQCRNHYECLYDIKYRVVRGDKL
jgi:hypothetical protein